MPVTRSQKRKEMRRGGQPRRVYDEGCCVVCLETWGVDAVSLFPFFVFGYVMWGLSRCLFFLRFILDSSYFDVRTFSMYAVLLPVVASVCCQLTIPPASVDGVDGGKF